MSVGCTLPAQTGTATCGTSWGPETMSLPWPYRQFGHLSRAEPACGGFFPLTNISVVWRGGFLLTARRAPRAAPPHSPGEGRPAAGGNSCGRSAGGRRGWRPAGRSSTPCTLPAKRPGTRRDAARRGMCCSSTAAASGLFGDLGQAQPRGQKGYCQQMPKMNSSSCSKRCPGTGSTTCGWGWQVGLLWDGCGRNLEHQNIGKKTGKNQK